MSDNFDVEPLDFEAAEAHRTPAPWDDYWYDETPGIKNSRYVTPDTAMGIATVFSCVRVIAEDFASIPCNLMQRTSGNGAEPAFANPLWGVLHDQPNGWQTSFEFREMMMGHLLLRGNAYAKIISHSNAVDDLIPLHPNRVKPFRKSNGEIGYEVRDSEGKFVEHLTQDQVFHIRFHSPDGIVGMSPVEVLRNAFSKAMSQEEYEDYLYQNNAQPGGILKTEQKLDEDTKREYKRTWNRSHGGPRNVRKVAVLDRGLDWTSVGMTNEDAQFLESRQFTREDICGIFRVPLYKVIGKATNGKTEDESIDYVVHSLRPWLVRWEQAIWRDLIAQKNKFFVEFPVDALLRGDAKSRADANAVKFQNGVISQDEWRISDNMNPLPNGLGKRYFVPLNLLPADMVDKYYAEKNANPQEKPGKPSPSGPGNGNGERAEVVAPNSNAIRLAVLVPVIADAADRVAKAELRELQKHAAKADSDRRRFAVWLSDFYSKHVAYVDKAFASIAMAWDSSSPAIFKGTIVGLAQTNQDILMRSTNIPDAIQRMEVELPERIIRAITGVLANA